jgi:signal transduction histidine kinase
LPKRTKRHIHLRIGRLLKTNRQTLEEQLFEIVDHLNIGRLNWSIIKVRTGRNRCASIGEPDRQAKAATAYESAAGYFKKGLALLATDSWQTEYTLTLNLNVEMAEAEYLNTHFAQTEILCQVVLQHAKTLLDKMSVYEVQIQAHIAQNQMFLAIELGLEVLQRLGVSLLDSPPENLNFELLSALPTMTEPMKLAAQRILMILFAPIYIVKPELLPSIAFTMVDLSIKHGNSPFAAFGYAFYGMLLSTHSSDPKGGYQFGQLALTRLEKYDANDLKCKVYNLINDFIHSWSQHARQTIEPLRETIQIGLDMGDIEYVGYATINYCLHLFWVGESLESVTAQQMQYMELLQQLKQEYSVSYVGTNAQLVLNLRGLAKEPDRLIGEFFNEVEMLPKWQATNTVGLLFSIYTAKSILAYFFKHDREAVTFARQAIHYKQSAAGLLILAEHNFYYSLALLADYPSTSTEQQPQYLEQMTANQQTMAFWAKNAPMNFGHKYDLVEAEKARLLGQNWQAAQLYEKAITGAKDNEYLHEEALAYELAAEFYLAQGMDKFAETYLKEAHSRYQQWGAAAKVTDLEKRYSSFLANITESTVIDKLRSTSRVLATRQITTTGNGQISLLDLETIMKASQTIAGEIQLEKLLSRLMNIILENAGAEKGFLLLEKHGQWVIEAQGATTQSERKVLPSLSMDHVLPEAIIHYVARTSEPVILNDAQNDSRFSLSEKIQSVLCVPLVNQEKISGIVYLENNLASGVFTPKRVETVQLLGSQAAISLDNARLYEQLAEYNRTLEAKVAERTQELSQALEHLKTTQQELIQSEKMAALGQLVAGIAHEINTPLGAIRASIGNIIDGLNDSVQQLPQLLQKLSLEQQRDFFLLTETALKNKKNLTSREERQIRRKILRQLEDEEIENADDMADTLVDMGIYQQIDSFMSLFQSPDQSLILQTAYHLTMQQIHSQNILTAVERASKVVFALKNYARYDSQGKMVKAKISDSIEVVLTLYYNQLKHGIEVTTHYQDIPEIHCYSDELNQVWTNLIHNAIQAMDNQGALEITVSESDHHILVQITDSGKGIPTDIQPRIFEPFFTTKPAGEGSGLGLDIVKKIIDKHHGKIDVDSQPGQTTFSVYLPIQ